MQYKVGDILPGQRCRWLLRLNEDNPTETEERLRKLVPLALTHYKSQLKPKSRFICKKPAPDQLRYAARHQIRKASLNLILRFLISLFFPAFIQVFKRSVLQ